MITKFLDGPPVILSVFCLVFGYLFVSLVEANEAVPLINKPSYAEVTGRVCYPSEGTPPMSIYARDVETRETFSVYVKKDAEKYLLKVPKEGEYIFFSWTHPVVDGYHPMGAIYSYAVPCGLNVQCKDHRPLPVQVKFGQRLENVDVCDYYYPFDRADEFVPKP